MVHAGFRRLAAQGLLAEQAVEIILDRLGDRGTLLMPAMSWRNITPQQPVFSELETAGHVGALSETFRLRYSQVRSLHPTHSVAGRGPLAEFLLSTHHLGCTPVPLASPYGKMRGSGAQVLMLGTGLETATVFHHAEEMIAPSLYLANWSELESYTLVDRKGNRYDFRLLRHRRVLRAFEKFRAPLKNVGALVDGETAGVPWTAFDLDAAIKLTTAALVSDAAATLADPSAVPA